MSNTPLLILKYLGLKIALLVAVIAKIINGTSQ